ncbi:hypothetical protein Pfo_021783 [Paulownia fortunei]|nr:hypothetical protein Pfo_021783 [Paulownia fortunei]
MALKRFDEDEGLKGSINFYTEIKYGQTSSSKGQETLKDSKVNGEEDSEENGEEDSEVEKHEDNEKNRLEHSEKGTETDKKVNDEIGNALIPAASEPYSTPNPTSSTLAKAPLRHAPSMQE